VADEWIAVSESRLATSRKKPLATADFGRIEPLALRLARVKRVEDARKRAGDRSKGERGGHHDRSASPPQPSPGRHNRRGSVPTARPSLTLSSVG